MLRTYSTYRDGRVFFCLKITQICYLTVLEFRSPKWFHWDKKSLAVKNLLQLGNFSRIFYVTKLRSTS